MQKLGKNYYWDELLALRLALGETPAVFTGRYKHTLDETWAVFTTIRPYTPGQRNPTVCNHVNIRRPVIGPDRQLSELDHNRKFYFVGRPSTYLHYGEERGCIEVAVDLPGPAFWKADQSAGSDAHARAAATALVARLEHRRSGR
ncbi:hypothetical protein V3W47_01730 [Deinococcus sp. YIM 134068]|uniref:hypothetical protein n=1 Tax=Deinococcus lichenicola TaxID=3118910 RepID=UPI002F9443F1